MTKLPDPTTAAGAFGQSVYLLDPTNGDRAVKLAAEAAKKSPRTIYRYLAPGCDGPPIAVAEAVDDRHRKLGGVEHNFAAWQERREQSIAGADGEVSPDPSKVLDLVNNYMANVTKQLRADKGDIQEIQLRHYQTIKEYAELTQALMERLDREGTARNRRADDRPPTRPMAATGPRLVRDGGAG